MGLSGATMSARQAAIHVASKAMMDSDEPESTEADDEYAFLMSAVICKIIHTFLSVEFYRSDLLMP